MNGDRDFDRGLESLERTPGRLRRERRLAAEQGAWAALAGALGDRHRRQSERLWSWLRSGLEPRPSMMAEAAGDDAATARVLALRWVSPELVVLRTSRPLRLSYAAGQHVKLQVGEVTRTYSLASAPHEPHLEFFIELHPGGAMSEVLRTLRPGRTVRVFSPGGDFRLSRSKRRHVMVATVTGIAPFVSLLRDALRAEAGGAAVFHVLHGASYQDQFGYRDELTALAARFPGRLFYLPAVSRAGEPRNAGWRGATGRVIDLVELYLRQHGLGAADTALYACGHPDMVGGVRKRFRPLGFELRVESY